MITTDGETETLCSSVAATRHGERARVSYLAGNPDTQLVRKQLEGTITESFTDGWLTLFDGQRHKSIHLTRVTQVVLLAGGSGPREMLHEPLTS